ncbi:MAG: tRNA dimethylallyltransferase [Gammaproteobacteria bacterium]|jgi:tRNA dimethylallyltransferase|nr:tRNA dimethylallyltransferase [Gammaproteobacteria bacterium]
MINNTVICLMGPTAAGKTEVAVELVNQLPCDIISVDSAMVYRGMNIGTAKPDSAVLAIAPHKLIDIRDPVEPYSAAEFCQDALNEIKKTIRVGRIPLLVGGTMLYFRALQQGLSALPSADSALRQRLSEEAAHLGWPVLHERLTQLDPASAVRIHKHDAQRIQRALEIIAITGKPLTQLYAEQKTVADNLQFINIGLVPTDRAILHARIATRFTKMLKQGFIEEVQMLRARPDLHPELPAMRAVGYRQVWDYLTGLIRFEEMQERGIIATRQLAKRQLTWLRHWPDVTWFDIENTALVRNILAILTNKVML